MSERPRRATPRPEFDQPTVLAASDPTRHVWGDSESGFVLDRVYLSSLKLHVLEFAMAPGGSFGHSRDNPTIFAADELLYVLEGTLMLTDPSTGECQRAAAGEALFFRRDTWHHGRACGDHGVRVLEFFSPTPATGASSAYARTQPYLEHVETVDQRLLGVWPHAAAGLRSQHRITPVREHDLAWGCRGGLEIGFFAATEHLTVMRCHLRAGASSQPEQHPGEEFVLLQSGSLVIHTPDAPEANCLYLQPGDAAVLPPDTPHSYLSTGNQQAIWLTAVAPTWTNPTHTTPPASQA